MYEGYLVVMVAGQLPFNESPVSERRMREVLACGRTLSWSFATLLKLRRDTEIRWLHFG
jgi:hypothetical protein